MIKLSLYQIVKGLILYFRNILSFRFHHRRKVLATKTKRLKKASSRKTSGGLGVNFNENNMNNGSRVTPLRSSKSISNENRVDIVLRCISSYMTALSNTQVYVERILAPQSDIRRLMMEIERAEMQLAKFQNRTVDDIKDLKFLPLYIVFLYGKIMWCLCQEGVVFDEVTDKTEQKIKVVHERSPTDNANIFINIFTITLDIWNVYFNAILEPGCDFEQTNLMDPSKISFYGKFLGMFMVDELKVPCKLTPAPEERPDAVILSTNFDAFKFFIVKNKHLMTIGMQTEEIAVILNPKSCFKACSSDHPLPHTLLKIMINNTLEHVMEVIYQERAYYAGVMKGLEISGHDQLSIPRAAGYMEEFSGRKKIQMLILRLKGELGSREKAIKKKFERICQCRALLHLKTVVKRASELT